MQVPCDYCGEQFNRKPSQIKKYKHNFCCRNCKGNWQKGQKKPEQVTGDWYPCEVCSTKVWRTPATLRDHVFCSTTCQRQFFPHPRLGVKGLSGENNPSWKGGYKNYYGSSWHFSRSQARKRDNHSCQRCGKTKGQIGKEPDVHHIIPFREFGIERHKEANKLSNLICLCRSCHVQVENGEPLQLLLLST